jgi:UDP-N-acetylmuramyl tripeptide synthase
LRRGLPTKRARVAVVTNVANDHLGEYGVNTVPELAQAKFAVHRTLPADGVLVLNADDPVSVVEAASVDKAICWFSLDPKAPQIVRAKAGGDLCAYHDAGALIYFDGTRDIAVMQVADAPITLGGAAKYNIHNVLAAICATVALDIPLAAIRAGLAGFKPDAQDNPGRCNEFTYNGARVFVDFAHNAHSISAISETLGAVPGQRRYLMQSHPGDRSDVDIQAGTTAALAFCPDVMIAAELPDHLRGRAPGEVPDMIVAAATAGGLAPAQITSAQTPAMGARIILDQIQPGDIALLLVLSDRDEVFAMLGAN